MNRYIIINYQDTIGPFFHLYSLPLKSSGHNCDIESKQVLVYLPDYKILIFNQIRHLNSATKQAYQLLDLVDLSINYFNNIISRKGVQLIYQRTCVMLMFEYQYMKTTMVQENS